MPTLAASDISVGGGFAAASSAATPVTSHLVVAERNGEPNRLSAELAIHVLAQLPVGPTASLPADFENDPLIEHLALAYRVEDSIRFRSRSAAPRGRGVVIDDEPEAQTPGELLDRLIDRVASEPTRISRPPEDDCVLEGHRVAVITNIPIHYRALLFELVERRLVAKGAAFHVFFLAQGASDRPWLDGAALPFSHEFVQSLDLGRQRARRLAPRGLLAALDRFAPTIVLSGGFSPFVSHRVARWCSPATAFGIWSGEIASRPTARSRIRKLQRQALAGCADYAIAYGWESARYLRSIRADLPIAIGRNSTRTPTPADPRNSTKRVELLAVSRAERDKALDLIVDAVGGLQDLDCRLTVVGDGPELQRLRARAQGSQLIRFLGALPHDEVLDLYRQSDVFLFPSQYDVFGLVLVEAMAAGLTVITSDIPGAVRDLAAPDSNCLVVSNRSSVAWADAIRAAVQDHSLRQRLGNRARRTVEGRWTLDHAADAMIAGFRLGALKLSNGGSA